MSSDKPDATRHLNEDQCTDILNGLVPRDQIEGLLDHLDKCAACERMFQARVTDFETLRSSRTPVRGPDGKWIFGGETTPSPQAAPSTRPGFLDWLTPRRLGFGLGALAVAVLIITVLVPSDIDTPVFRIPEGREIRQLRSQSTVDPVFYDGVLAYDGGKFETAVEKLRSADVDGPYAQLRTVYLASALTMQKRYAEASDLLRSLDALGMPPPWRDEARWIYYIALFGSGESDRAARILEELVKLDGDIGDRARERDKRTSKR